MEFLLTIITILTIAFFFFLVNFKYSSWREQVKIEQTSRGHRSYGYIYFYRGRGENPFYVKIGRTNKWESRLSSARTSVGPNGLHIYGIVRVKDEVWAETYIHDKFAHLRPTKKNEWFRMSLELYLYILKVRDMAITEEARRRLT